MSLPERKHSMPSRRRLFNLAIVGLLAASTAGCFQPMYAETTPGEGSALRDQLGDVEVVFADGRIGNEVRNDLIFELTGGSGNPVGAPYRLVLRPSTNATAAVVDPYSGLPEVELVTVNVSWQLFDTANPKVAVKQGTAFGKASLDSGYQRFARSRAVRDAENRSAKVAAESIRGQLASYFVTRTPKT